MPETSPAFAPERYRTWLLLFARTQWDNALQDWGDPSDIVQQTLLEAHQNQHHFKGESARQFAAWLKQILMRNLIDVGRAVNRKKCDWQRKRPLEAPDDRSLRLRWGLALDAPSPSIQAVNAEQRSHLISALGKLPPEQRNAVILHHLRDLSLAETAAEMGRTQAAVAGLLRRGLKRLRQLLDARGAS